MRNPTDEEISEQLIGIISDGFNRSLRVLEEAGAIKRTAEMKNGYTGIGSRLYDLVTQQMIYTASYAAPEIRRLFEGDRTFAGPITNNQ